MKIRLRVVGKPRNEALRGLHDEYATRLVRLGVDYRSDWAPDARRGGRLDTVHARAAEGRGLLDGLDPRHRLIALDPSGDLMTSEQVSGRLEAWASPGCVFVVGGPLGLAESVLDRAAFRWSLSPLTFPHELVRVLVVEQLWRGFAILRNLPYHRGEP